MAVSYKNSRPNMCGYYSMKSDREFDETASSLKYFKKPLHFGLDLNKGIESTNNKPNYFEEKMGSILTYIVKNKADLMFDPEKGDGDTQIPSSIYITYRGIIRKIMCSPYEERKGWCILVTKYKNNFYMAQLTKQADMDAFNNEPLSSKRFCYYEQKFKQYCLTDAPSKMPDHSQKIGVCSQFIGVFKRLLVGRNFFFAGEMDGIISDKPVDFNKCEKLNNLTFIELKVATDPSCSWYAPEIFKRSKSLKAWTQSFLTGVQDVSFGMRDKRGIVRNIQHYSVDSLLHLGQNYWDPAKCFKFLDDFLKLVEEKTIKTDCPYTVFEFNYNAKTTNITCTEHPGKTDLTMVPDWYLDAFQT